MLRSVGLAVRAMLVLLCALGLVSMHQMAAVADAGHPSHSARHCHPAATTSAADDSCSVMAHTCGAVPVEPAMPPAPSESSLDVQSPADATCQFTGPRVGSGTDPPDLTQLSVSRT